MKNWLPAGFIFALSTAFLVAATFSLPERVRQIAVVYQPGTTLPQIVTSAGTAGARVVRLGLYDNIAIVDFGREVQTTGIDLPDAWLMIDPVRLGSCGLDTVAATRPRADTINL